MPRPPLIASGSILLILSTKGLAAEDVKTRSEFTPAVTTQTDRVKILGWDSYLKLGLTGNVSDNSRVVGKENGQSTTLGLKIDAALDFKEVDHEWLNTMTLFASATRTPLLPRYVKVDDTLDAESLFKYYFAESYGAFARLNLDAPMFAGYDNRTSPAEYSILKVDGSRGSVLADRLKLTDGLRPFKLRESIGAFANLVKRDIVSWDAKAGIGFRQVYANHQYVLNDDAGTLPIEVEEIRNSTKAGYEFGSDIGGKSNDQKLKYRFSFNILFPFYERPEDDATGDDHFEKRVIDIAGQLSYSLAEWASLDYVLKVVRDPSILPRAQLSQAYLFSLNRVLAARVE